MNPQVPIIIPAYKPDNKLINLVFELKAIQPNVIIIIVNDGSGKAFEHLFTTLKEDFNCIVLKHSKNQGKGTALKTAFKYCVKKLPYILGIVTADADGQHLVKDIYKIQAEVISHQSNLILGVRDFIKNKMPFRSRFGNIFTKYLLFFFIRNFINDTQTGLRGIPINFLPYILSIDGDGYEYEMNMLMVAQANNIAITEITITTVYIENNRDSHFNPLFDSLKIYWIILKFGISSASAALLDFTIFSLLIHFNVVIFYSLLSARISSVIFGFIINYKVVFRARKNLVKSLFYYLLLAISLFTGSYLGIRFLHFDFGINEIVAKVIVEMFLFLISFTLQKKIIFKL